MLGYGAMELRGAPRARDISEAQAETILNAVLVLRDAIVHNAVAWPALAVTSASLAATGVICWFAALRLFTRETLLIKS